MASPPPSATSPTSATTPLALPRQRPSLVLPGQTSTHSSHSHARKHSVTSQTSSAHPLRQTSFPPPDTHERAGSAAVYSPSQNSQDEFSDSEIVSAISGPGDEHGNRTGRKRKRGGGRQRGRPPKGAAHGRTGSASLVNGDEGGSRRSTAAPSVAPGNNGDEAADDEDDDEEVGTGGGGRVPLYEGGQRSQAELSAENQQRAMFSEHIAHIDSLPLSQRPGLTVADHSSRYEAFGRSKLRVADVRRLVNQTLSQSVPPNIITVVSSYTKLFAGMLIEGAREVQGEWEACQPLRADGAENPLYKRIKRSHEGVGRKEEEDTTETQAEIGKPSSSNEAPANGGHAAATKREHVEASSNGIKREPNSHSPQELPDAPADAPAEEESSRAKPNEALYPGGAGGLSTSLRECDRGPLQPDHLREALRRYKKARKGGTVGFTGLSLEGREVAASRMGGRRLFR